MGFIFKIKYMDIHESYFKGKVEFREDEYTINLQNERRGKVLKLPFKLPGGENKVLVRMTGPNVAVEDFLPFCGESEWVEIDSDVITFYVADHQDQFDTLEIIDDFSDA
tara:strand:- start:1245 stop:1571 length:327 start_codon:yes stop_codon:yes gene_type:complete